MCTFLVFISELFLIRTALVPAISGIARRPYTDQAVPGLTYTTTYDALGRPDTLQDSRGLSVVGGTSYNAAGQPTDTRFNFVALGAPQYFHDYRSYNAMNQLTSIDWNNGAFREAYNYSSGADNGQIGSMTDTSGATTTYTYDSLGRLGTASNSAWGQAYTYDGFGNLTDKTVTAGTAPTLHIAIDQTTNRIGAPGYCYDLSAEVKTKCF